jgi:hypothetical protein
MKENEHEEQERPDVDPKFQKLKTWVLQELIQSGILQTLGSVERDCFLVIWAYANHWTGKAFPNVEAIIGKTGHCKSSICRATNNLHVRRLIAKQRTSKRLRFKNAYILNFDVSPSATNQRRDAHPTPENMRLAVSKLAEILDFDRI